MNLDGCFLACGDQKRHVQHHLLVNEVIYRSQNLIDCGQSPASVRFSLGTSSTYLVNLILSNLPTFLHNQPLPTTTSHNHNSLTDHNKLSTTTTYRMRPLLFASLLVAAFFGLTAVSSGLKAASSGLKAIPYGEIWSAETLFASPTPSSSPILTPTSTSTPNMNLHTTTASTHYDFPKHDDATQDPVPPGTIKDDDGENTSSDVPRGTASRKPFNMDDHFHNKKGDDWGLYVPIDRTRLRPRPDRRHPFSASVSQPRPRPRT